MTCEAYRTMVSTTDPRRATVAEREAARRHAIVCRPCFDFTMAMPGHTDPVKKAEARAIGSLINVLDALNADPEK